MTFTNNQNTKKERQLEKITNQIKMLETSPLYNYRIENGYKPVIGEGDPDARIMFIGEAPGAQEAKTGRPFVGRAGKFLDSLLNSVNLDRKDVYITNIVKDRPPSNRLPLVGEIKIYGPFILEQIKIIQPEIIATLGRLAMKFIFKLFNLPQKNMNISELHGEIFLAQAEIGSIKIIPFYHPAAVFYNRDLEQKIREDFKKLQENIDKA